MDYRYTEPPDKHKEDILRAWSVLDQNGDNRVSATELVRGARYIGLNPTLQEAKKMIAEVDTDNDGYISFEEFEKSMNEHYDVIEYQEQEIRQAFKRFDKEGTGFLDHSQLKRALVNMSEQLTDDECKEFFNLADANHDGKIDIEEFVVLFTAK